MDFFHGDIPVNVVFEKRKTLSMTFDHDGVLNISAPSKMSMEEVRLFVEKHKRWVRTHYVKIKGKAEHYVKISVEEGGTVMYLGEVLKVRMGEKNKVLKIGDEMFFPEGAGMEDYFKWLKGGAKEYLTRGLDTKAYEAGISFSKIKITSATTRWGSCNENGVISLSWRLMMCPKEAIDYVLIHELCHRIHMDHSEEFWEEVEKRMPDYRVQKKWLDDHSYLMEI